MRDAARAWESAADVHFRHDASQDASCNASNPNVVFDVELVSGQPYLARAFFPNYARGNRNLNIDATSFSAAPYTLTGILRHELGHTIGFRHEHTRPEAATCFKDNNWRPLTPYDAASVMHYPQCSGTNTGDLTLTAMDSTGVRNLYGAQAQVTATRGFAPVPAPGCATTVATSGGDTWILGCDDRTDGNHSIFRLAGTTWQPVAGVAKSIALSPEGAPWVVNAAGAIYKWNGSSFAPLAAAGCATAIGVGRNGAAWVIGCAETSPGNHGIFRYTGSSWQGIAGEGKAIAVSPEGTPWVVNAAGGVYRWNGASFAPLEAASCAREIGVGAGDSAWVIGCNDLGAGGYGVYGWNGLAWQGVPGAATKIAVSPAGSPTVVNGEGTVFTAK